jgi:hypothetical protein
VRDLEQIVARAATLGPIEPPRDLWTGIESRIGASVIPLASRRRTIPLVRGLAAAAVLVAATAGITWKLAHVAPQPNAPTTVASGPTNATPDEGTNVVEPTNPAPGGGPVLGPAPQLATNNSEAATGRTSGGERTTRASSSGAQLVGYRGRVAGESDVYDREISRLRTVMRSRKADLDPRTVLAIEKSLAVIDTAIMQARSALAADPASRFLNDQLTHALDKKVELLRTAALLPARS